MLSLGRMTARTYCTEFRTPIGGIILKNGTYTRQTIDFICSSFSKRFPAILISPHHLIFVQQKTHFSSLNLSINLTFAAPHVHATFDSRLVDSFIHSFTSQKVLPLQNRLFKNIRKISLIQC